MALDYPLACMEERFDELKRYVRFTADDARRIASFKARASPHFSRIAQEFYERSREHEDAHAVFTGEDQIARLQKSMVRWLEGLFGGVYDAAYFAQTERIGRMHVKVGLPQRYMFTAMAVIRSSLSAIVDAEGGAEASAIRDALSRLLDVELAVMLESHREDLVARVERSTRLERDTLSRRAAQAQRHYVEGVELAAILFIAIDARGEILLFNAEAERVSGYARDEVIGRRFVDVFIPEDVRESAAANFTKDASGGVLDVPLMTRSGKLRDVHWQIARARGDDVALFAIGVDLTDERVSRERQKQQERLAAVGTLAAGLAHEIRNPLNGARLHVSFLERALKARGSSPEAIEAVRVVDEEIQRLARLVTDFLDFARPRPLALATTSVRALCERGMQLVAKLAESSKVTVRLDLPSHDVVLDADAQRLEQVVLNLLHNAIEALAPHGGNVVLRARREPRHARIEVEDDGPGTSASDAEIFDAFFSTKQNGTGLGLAIVHRIVTDHGGSIDVDSRPGRTVFRIRLPMTSEGTRR